METEVINTLANSSNVVILILLASGPVFGILILFGAYKISTKYLERFVVAVDGPAGSGKGTITKRIAEEMKLTSIDTGAMYRSVTLAMLEKNIKVEELDKIKNLLDQIKIEFKKSGNEQKIYLNDKDVSIEIRSKEVNENVSQVSAIDIVRSKMVELQRIIAQNIDVIMEGRDIGTNVFPNADVKIYLDATPEERARRRFKQNEENGINIPFEEILENVKQRDFIDSTRKNAPLKKAEDAIYIDSSNMTIEEVVNEIKQIIIKKK